MNKATGLAARAALLSAILLAGVPALALGPDQYIGDTAIYAGTSARIKPNVLLLIDNSNAAGEIAAGTPYNPRTVYPNQGYNSWGIYAAGTQGEFKPSAEVVANNSVLMENLNCSNNDNIIRRTLFNAGTYSGQGTVAYPNISNQAKCATGPKGETYALGNYLNYTKTPPKVPVVIGTDGKDYRLIQAHTSSAASRPVSGAQWSTYWQPNLNSSGAQTTGLGVVWKNDLYYTLTGSTQIRIVYESIRRVVGGSRFAVRFGAMVYSSNNKGGRVIYPVSDLSSDTAFNNFLNALPGSGAPGAAPLLSSQTARPQGEALLDAGHYFKGLRLPISGDGPHPSPIQLRCEPNFIIFITNGLTNETEPTGSSPFLSMRLYDELGNVIAGGGALKGDLDGDGAEAFAYGSGHHYLDDVAKWLYESDLIPDTGTPTATSPILRDKQNVRTSMILAFQGADPLVERAGSPNHGRGGFFNVYNASELSQVLTQLITNIVLETDTTFIAPVVPTSPENRARSGKRIYLGFFRPISQEMWHGNLKKFVLDRDINLLAYNSSGEEVLATDPLDGSFLSGLYSLWSDFSEPDTGSVEKGGVGARLLGNTSRRIYTFLGATDDLTQTSNALVKTNALLTTARLNVTTSAEKEKVIDFARGLDAFDVDGDGNVSERREWILGDILHSKPLILSYAPYTFTTANEQNGPPGNDWTASCVGDSSTGATSCNKTVIYVGANDGMLHAFADYNGEELWGFVPPNLLGNLKHLSGQAHTYFVDGTPIYLRYDRDGDGIVEVADGDRVVIIFGTRRGGGLDSLHPTQPRGAYHALDVSNPGSPRFLWSISASTRLKSDGTSVASGLGELGETFSHPSLAYIKDGTTFKWVMFIGAGYDNNEDLRFGSTQGFPLDPTSADPALNIEYNTSQPTNDYTTARSNGSGAQVNPRGRGVYCIEIAAVTGSAGNYGLDFSNSGQKLWGYTNADNSDMSFSFPSDVLVIDRDDNKLDDTLVVGDTGGNMWMFDVSDTTPSQWTARRVFASNPGTDGTNGRKIFFPPAYVKMDEHNAMLFFGTGDREHPTNYLNAGATDGAVQDGFYAVKIKYDDPNPLPPSVITETHLVDVTGNELQKDSTTAAERQAILAALTTDVTKYGWFMRLDRNDGEKVLATAEVLGGWTFFTTYTPNTGSLNDPCDVGNQGTARLYILNAITGEAVYNFFSSTQGVGGTGTDYSGERQDTATNDRALVKDRDGNILYVLRADDRSMILGSGIPPEVQFVVGDEIKLLVPAEDKVMTQSLGSFDKIVPVYWMQW